MADSSHAIIYLIGKIKSRGYLFRGSLGKLNYKFMIIDFLAAKKSSRKSLNQHLCNSVHLHLKQKIELGETRERNTL